MFKGNIISSANLQALCGKYLIDVDVALENDEIMDLLMLPIFTQSDKKSVLFDIEEILKEQF
jgi:hypothetical protein